MEKYINNYNNQIYKDYLKRLQIYYDYKLKILKKPGVEGLYYKEDENKYELKYNNMSLILTKPKYKDVFKEIEKIKDEKNELKLEYNELQYRILHNLNDEKDYKKYQDIVDKLIKLDNEVKDLLEYYIKINSIQKNLVKINLDDINILNKEKEDLYNKISIENDSILTRKYINDYLELIKKIIELKNTNYKTIDYIIVELPKIKEENIKIIEKNVKKVKKEKVKKTEDEILQEINSKLKKKIKKKLDKTSKEDLNKLEKSVKEKLFKIFKFNNKDECASRAHSAKFFTKKLDLIDIIKKSHEIEKRLPANYQGLSKQKLCEELYKL